MASSHDKQPSAAELRQVSQAAGLAIAAAALCGGAVVAGATHFMSTAKKLTEEGVDPSARVRAMPLAMKALLISTAVTTAAGVAVLLGTRFAGVDAHSVATISSWQTAILVAQQQRDAVRLEFQRRLHPGGADSNDSRPTGEGGSDQH